jgi:serine O-acetyltransferase
VIASKTTSDTGSARDIAALNASTWQQYVNHLAATRPDQEAASPLRTMGEELARRALALLFTQFSHTGRKTSRNIRDDATTFEQLLQNALQIVLPEARVADVTTAFLDSMSNVHDMLLDDANAILVGDPAAESLDEVILAYPGFLATAVHRVAHQLYQHHVPILPRLVSEWAHRETGIDIHPGASIGRRFAIDHGTGVVIGETSVIGNGVRIYQGVTLGALAVNKKLAHKKRHPIIGDDVIIYANATILGGTTEVGEGSIIGGNVWLTNSVPARSIVQFSSNVEQRRNEDDGLEFHI